MKKILVITILAASSLVLSQCAPKSTSKFYSGKESLADKVAETRLKYTQAQLDEGKTISISRCKKCHRYHEASEKTVKQWDKILVKMVRKAHLSLDSAREVHAYYVLNAKQG